jgi:colanic acid/amylovoran biosynthesis glycosyltransferase
MSDIAIIYDKITNPFKPHRQAVFEGLKQSGLPLSYYTLFHEPNKLTGVNHLPQWSSKTNVIKSSIKTIFTNPVNSYIWLSKFQGIPVKNRIKLWGIYGNLFINEPKVIHLISAYLYRNLLSVLMITNTINIVSFHGFELIFYHKLVQFWQDNLIALFNNCHLITFVSNYLRQKAIKLGLSPEQAFVIYPGIDINFYQPDLPHNREREKDQFILITVSRLSWEKGYVNALKAVKMVLDAGFNVTYFIIGEGANKDELLFWINKLGIEYYVHLCGHQTPKQVKALLARSDIYIQPSRIETFCQAAAEASAMELPVIASDVGGLSEVIEHNNTGFLVQPDNPDQIAEGIISLIDNQELRITMGKNGRKRVCRLFSVDKEIEQWIALYKKALQLAKR